jgi:hypothetical protein
MRHYRLPILKDILLMGLIFSAFGLVLAWSGTGSS